jgi:hypothetical protein
MGTGPGRLGWLAAPLAGTFSSTGHTLATLCYGKEIVSKSHSTFGIKVLWNWG